MGTRKHVTEDPTDPNSDLGWFADFKAGSHLGMKAVYERYWKQIGFYVGSIVRNNTDAEDISQTVFSKAWENRQKMDTPLKLKNWLYRVATNESINHLREKGRKKKIEVVEDQRPVDFEITYAGVINALGQHLENIPGGEVIRMSYLEGKSTKDIAVQLNMTENNVYIIKSRGLKILRKLLKNSADD